MPPTPHESALATTLDFQRIQENLYRKRIAEMRAEYPGIPIPGDWDIFVKHTHRMLLAEAEQYFKDLIAAEKLKMHMKGRVE